MSHPPKTPGAVVTAGVLLAVYGALLLICGICSGFSLFVNDPAQEAIMIQDVPGYTIIKFVDAISTLLVAILMIVSGVGLFQLFSFARLAAYPVCVYQIFFVLAFNLHQAIFVVPVMPRLLALQMQNQPQPPPFDVNQFGAVVMWLKIAVAIIVPLAFCLPVLYLLSSKPARDAFSGVSQPDPDDDRERRPRHDGYDDDDDGYDRPKSPPKSPGDTGIRDRS